jgi:hypothetical protein
MIAIAGRLVLVRAMATFAAVGLPATIVFAPQGLSARDLVRAMRASPAVAVVVCAGWLALSAVATNAVFTAPGLTALRAARPPRWQLLPALFALASVVQLPWAVLWLRGAGVGAALAAVLFAVGAAASLFTLTRRPSVRALLLLPLPPLALLEAWRVAPEARSDARIWTRANATPLVALVTVHLLRLVRVERLRLLLATMIGSLGAAGLLTLRSEPTPRPGGRAVAIMTVPLVLIASLFIAPILACEDAIRARLRVLRVRHAVVVGAFFAAVAAPTTAFAATAAGVTSAPAAPVLATSLALSAVVVAWGRRHATMRKRGPTVFAIGVALIALVAVTLAMELL